VAPTFVATQNPPGRLIRGADRHLTSWTTASTRAIDKGHAAVAGGSGMSKPAARQGTASARAGLCDENHGSKSTAILLGGGGAAFDELPDGSPLSRTLGQRHGPFATHLRYFG